MQLSKRQSLQPCLQVVATPIGNLKDLSPRALEAFEAAQGIFCEDTRVTMKLLHAHGVEKKTCLRLDAHSTAQDLDRACDRILAGGTWILVSDAGTPAVSDPGARMVARAREKGIDVQAIPGPSALAAFLSIAGIEAKKIAFYGFFPRKKGEQAELLEAMSEEFAVWFESGPRIEETLVGFAGRGWTLVVAKELTKMHERVWVGTSETILDEIRSRQDDAIWKGEWVFGALAPAVVLNNEDSMKALQCLLNAGVSASEAARQISQVFGVSRGAIYKRIISKGD